jgi:acyl-CoA thioester hydrolase
MESQMARISPWQRERSSYPYSAVVARRPEDVPEERHIHNTAIARMFDTGRVGFLRELAAFPRGTRPIWLVASVSIAYLREMALDIPVEIASGIQRLGRTSWTIGSAAFQDGHCCATCETVFVVEVHGAPFVIDDAMRGKMAEYGVAGD